MGGNLLNFYLASLSIGPEIHSILSVIDHLPSCFQIRKSSLHPNDLSFHSLKSPIVILEIFIKKALTQPNYFLPELSFGMLFTLSADSVSQYKQFLIRSKVNFQIVDKSIEFSNGEAIAILQK